MDPDFILILGLLFLFLAFSIYSLISYFKRSSSVTGRLIIGLLILLISTLLLFTIIYKFFYTELNDINLIVYYVILLLAFSISVNLSQLITQKIKTLHKVQALSITFCFLTILISFIITLIFYYSVGFIDSANLLGNK